ncbi:MAG TPA: hypothetical protein PL009_13960 [Flavipsychrobacter sp.]|nr:hypothetical protein [Flavipsychrobacter sp.]
MKKTLLLVCVLCFLLPSTAFSQTDFSIRILAGARAPWGEVQLISIDGKGNGKHKLTNGRTGDIDSTSFSISKDELSKLREALNTVNFFNLNEGYNTQSVDGSAMSVSATMAGKSKEVTWFNVQNKETTILKDRLNGILKKKGITIRY